MLHRRENTIMSNRSLCPLTPLLLCSDHNKLLLPIFTFLFRLTHKMKLTPTKVSSPSPETGLQLVSFPGLGVRLLPPLAVSNKKLGWRPGNKGTPQRGAKLETSSLYSLSNQDTATL